jgi:hypothetical protein
MSRCARGWLTQFPALQIIPNEWNEQDVPVLVLIIPNEWNEQDVPVLVLIIPNEWNE